MPYSFRGGVHPPQNKSFTAYKRSEVLPAPERLYFPMSMHVGAPCEAQVAPGDPVLVGQVIGRSDAPVSAPIHCSVSGTVESVGLFDHPNGRKVMTVTVKNDGLYTEHPDLIAAREEAARIPPEERSPEEIINAVRSAGIVGMGGAGFPTAFKLSSVQGKVSTLIINAAECEPYITADNRLLVERTDDVLRGIGLLMKALSLSHCVLAIESNKSEAIDLIRDKLAGTGILLHVLRTKYPQGSEKHIIKAVTGREVPSGKLPGDIGCCVLNPASAAATFDAVAYGLPLITRYVTISGSAIVNCQNFIARIGTPVTALIEAAGGYSKEPQRLIIGGPMMGTAQYRTEVPIIKTTNSVLVFGENEGIYPEDPQCIRCGKCVAVCPMGLQPVYINLYASKGQYEYCESRLNVRDCIECGACAYKCPGRLPLVQAIRVVKQKIGPAKKK